MGSNQNRAKDIRARINSDLRPRIQRFIENEHRGTINSAVNALVLRALNALESGDNAGTRSSNSAA